MCVVMILVRGLLYYQCPEILFVQTGGTIDKDSLTPAIIVCRFCTLSIRRVATARIFGEKGTDVPFGISTMANRLAVGILDNNGPLDT